MVVGETHHSPIHPQQPQWQLRQGQWWFLGQVCISSSGLCGSSTAVAVQRRTWWRTSFVTVFCVGVGVALLYVKMSLKRVELSGDRIRFLLDWVAWKLCCFLKGFAHPSEVLVGSSDKFLMTRCVWSPRWHELSNIQRFHKIPCGAGDSHFKILLYTSRTHTLRWSYGPRVALPKHPSPNPEGFQIKSSFRVFRLYSLQQKWTLWSGDNHHPPMFLILLSSADPTPNAKWPQEMSSMRPRGLVVRARLCKGLGSSGAAGESRYLPVSMPPAKTL